MARIVNLDNPSNPFPNTVAGYIAYSRPTTTLEAAYQGTAGKISRIDWIDVTVYRTDGNSGTDSVLRLFTTESGPWVGSPTAGFEGTWTQTAGSEAFSQIDDQQCQIGSAPSAGNGASSPSASQTLRFVPDDPAAFAANHASSNLLVTCYAVDEPTGSELPTSPPGVQRGDPSEWAMTAASAQVRLKGGPHIGLRR
jgi:hypothetical protein